MTAKVHANTYVSLMSGPLTLVIIFKSPVDWLGAATIRGTFLDNTQAYINILMQYNQIASIHVTLEAESFQQEQANYSPNSMPKTSIMRNLDAYL